MHYTIHHDEVIDARIASDVALLRERLVAAFPRLEALVLVGGFGRGEGSAVIEENGNIRPVNDYDLVLLANQPCDVSRIDEIRRDLAQRLGTWWVDISVYTVAQVRKLRYTMYHYDLKYGSRVIYGDPTILSLIPPMDPAKMPLVEAETEFYTRLWCFLGPFSIRFLNQSPGEEERFFLANQLSKAVLACSDALLIRKGVYHHSYVERLSRFEQALPERSDLLHLVQEATEFKLHPTRDIPYDVVERWFQVRRVFLDTMWYFVNRMYGREFRDWQAYAWWYRNNPRQILHRLGYLALKRDLRHERRISVNLAQLFLLLAFEQGQVDTGLFDLAKRELGRTTGTDQSGLDWDAARAMAAQLRMEV